MTRKEKQEEVPPEILEKVSKIQKVCAAYGVAIGRFGVMTSARCSADCSC